MAVKTWTSERVTSADINTYLTNGGLVWIKEQTIGSAVTSVTVTSVFSASFDNYVITISGGAGSTSAAIMYLKLGSTATGYYNALQYVEYGATPKSTGLANTTVWDYVGSASTDGIRAHITLLSPYLSKSTQCHSLIAHTTSWAGTQAGYLNNTTSYTDFTIGVNSGTMTGGTVRVYGYRQA